MSEVKKIMRGGVSYEYRKKFIVSYKEMWQSRKILRITSEKANIKISGYIVGNLLKHKEVSTFEELKNNKFSSYWHTVEKYGDEEAQNLVYSVINLDEDEWGEINLKQFDL